MPSYKSIQASNALLSGIKSRIVAVFVGGTSGIGKATIKALAATGAEARIHVIGRKASKDAMSAFIQDLQSINSKAEIIWTAAEVSLLSEVKRVCEDIKRQESRVDLLFMSAGYAPHGPRIETTEGLEVTQSLEYYSRILFIRLLIPLLCKSESPRVISVLAGGLEPSSITLDDIDLKEPSNFGGLKTQGHYAAMGTLALEQLAEIHQTVTFIHSFPGWVKTGNHRRGAEANSIPTTITQKIMEPLLLLLSFSEEESGQRHLFECTSAMFGGQGTTWDGEPGTNSMGERTNGLFLVNDKCECTTNDKALPTLRKNAAERVWVHTQKVLQPYM
ncbi:hypothetical protein FSARC_12296 [Fusarium sarcochroum]|uniref:Uncharacterized protein n=1 Tax=Fusarium sarcochroum TaxID=1208366 RepID=A0A8H4T9P7_9HYPO|nr:hypothetical protein FSARC_12296 [Fusarium sarcochroum]